MARVILLKFSRVIISKGMSKFLSFLIQAFHILVILFVLFAPLVNHVPILILHITFVIGLLFHWYGNSDVCCLSVLEGFITGTHYTDTFIHRVISPIYSIDDMTLNSLIHCTTWILLFFSVFKLYHNPHFWLLVRSVKTNGLFDSRTLQIFQQG
jgi:hypothetical protein